ASACRSWCGLGMALSEARPSVMPTMTITTMISTRVKPRSRMVMVTGIDVSDELICRADLSAELIYLRSRRRHLRRRRPAGRPRLAGTAQQLGHDQHAENADDDHDDHDLDEGETALAAPLHAMRNVLHRIMIVGGRKVRVSQLV